MIDSPNSAVGIDDIAAAFPKLFISTTGEFARARGIEPAKLARGIGVEKMAVPDAHEDAATLAAASTLELMEKNDLRPAEVGKIYIGTESGVDEAKAMGTYVIGMLERVYGPGTFSECSTVEFKAACIGATHALESVACWLKAGDDGGGEDADGPGRRRGRVGIVVATDVARYELGSSGEYTQGAGSVALLIKRNPRILALDPVMGVYTRDENDFFRPVGMRCAVVNGKYSNQCYLAAMDGAFSSFQRRALSRGMIRIGEGGCLSDHLRQIIFHIPYPRMAEYAAASFFRREWRPLPRWREVEEEIGAEPAAEEVRGEEGAKASADYQRRFSKSAKFLEAYERKVKPSTLISSAVGNIYTGSIYLGLASLLAQDLLTPGARIGLGSYGSGCSATFFSGVVGEGVRSLARGRILERLEDRVEIGLEVYEHLHDGKRRESVIPPEGEFALLRIGGDGYRHYDLVG